MASGPINSGKECTVEKNRFLGCKVYTRKVFKCLRKPPATAVGATTTTTCITTTTIAATNEPSKPQQNCDGNLNESIDEGNNERNPVQSPPKILALGDLNSSKQQTVKHVSENNVASRSKQEMIELKKKLKSQLDVVRSMAMKIEVREGEVVEFNRLRPAMNDGKLRRVHSVVASSGVPREVFRHSRPLNQLSMPVVSEHVEKEKRTPKANQFYRNSEFLLAKDKFPPAESNKKVKLNGKKHYGGDAGHGFGPSSKIFKRCSALHEKLMKHKHGWIFNTPVDVKGLGLHDYFTIIKHPMDLGTIKTRLNTNSYKSPKDFAEDVRLTFHNAMTYNPEGQDVHVVAEELSNVFEDKWSTIEADYDRETRFSTHYDMILHSPTSRKTTSLSVPSPPDMRRILNRSETIDSRPRLVSVTPSSRTPAPKKPKARDPHKREMTYDEKQKLSVNLSNLPAEKIDAIVQIMQKRNPTICQRGNEIEVDIDSVDTETLWELDRLVINYKKSVSKHKRKTELSLQARAEAERKIQKQTPDQTMVEAPEENATERNVSSPVPVQAEKQGDNKSRSSSSSSSSTDSGSSSSDSDSDSSSGSDVGGSK